ncbi:DNA-binding protein [Vogesella oryzae]|uniref:DNA-binding protein n=1 Tax=Vogesella oryzae TaxID=1735285 RepID=UPI0015836A22|nr:DNA-binding protein [Vogesella oryzae]
MYLPPPDATILASESSTEPALTAVDAPAALVSFDDVATVAELLAGDHQPVTLASVCEAIGDAPLTQVQQHLAAWRASRAQAVASPAVTLPAPLADALTAWAQQLVSTASSSLQDTITETNADLAMLCQHSDQLEHARDRLQQQLTTVTAARDQALATLAECDTQIERLTLELQHARDLASNALVGKAKDQLAIDGKDTQLAELRRQLERSIATSSAESDARLAAEMELVGAATARDNLALEVRELRAQLEICLAERRGA